MYDNHHIAQMPSIYVFYENRHGRYGIFHKIHNFPNGTNWSLSRYEKTINFCPNDDDGPYYFVSMEVAR